MKRVKVDDVVVVASEQYSDTAECALGLVVTVMSYGCYVRFNDLLGPDYFYNLDQVVHNFGNINLDLDSTSGV